MAFEDFREKLSQQLQATGEKLGESRLYQIVMERYENLSTVTQRIVKFLAALSFAFLVLLTPFDQLFSAYTTETDFEQKRELVRKMIKSHREMNSLSDIPAPVGSDSVKTDLEFQFKSLNFLPEQVKKIEVNSSPTSNLIPSNKLSYGVDIQLQKLNLKQINTVGHKLQAINPSIKLKDVILTLNREDSRYLDAEFKLVALNIPQYTVPIPPPEETKKKKKKSNSSSGQNE